MSEKVVFLQVINRDPPTMPNRTPFVARATSATISGAAIAAQSIGTAGAYVRQIPILGALAIEPLAFFVRNVQQGYQDTMREMEMRRAKGAKPNESQEA